MLVGHVTYVGPINKLDPPVSLGDYCYVLTPPLRSDTNGVCCNRGVYYENAVQQNDDVRDGNTVKLGTRRRRTCNIKNSKNN